MPPDSGMAFVLIQHLDPAHESLTAELLGRHTKMSVVQVKREMSVEPNHVYVIPPNKYLSIRERRLRLSSPDVHRALRMPVDFLLRSLAEDQRERAVGIVLSGTGTDGTLGLKEIKAAGGLSIVQDPETAQYDGMPRSAIAGDSVDQAVSIDKMPQLLLAYAQHRYLRNPLDARPVEEEAPQDFADVVGLLRARAKFDFGPYKKGTLGRRVHRRMGLRHVERLADYLQLLRTDPAEVNALHKDVLIGVSSFFREPAAWDALTSDVLRRMVAQKPAGTAVRAWVPACATGEEAYSLAMLLIEQLQATQKSCDIQIFASDVDTQALEQARAGVYPESVAADVSPERLRHFFVRGDSTYRVNKELRESVVFANQNVITDPPFSKLDLISCRNLLIYLEADVQKKIVSLFHFALTEGGYLFLGSAESIGQAEDLFEPVSKKWRIYRRIGTVRSDRVHFPIEPPPERTPRMAAAPRAAASEARLAEAVHQLLLDRYAPASVVINRRFSIVHFAGPTHKYLAQPPGPPTRDLIAQAREGLATKLRGVVHRALREDQQVTLTGVRVRRNDHLHRVRLTVEPLKVAKETEGLLLVCFEDEPTTSQPPPETTASSGGDEWLVRQLEHELKTTREDLQSTIEELEASNEELKAANEEAMSVHEELQSTNEELETSQEEMQSLNEELSTVNNQLQSKVAELERANDDLDNLLTSTGMPTIFLDRRLRIRHFTPSATDLFNLIPSDIGRPIRDIAQKFIDPDLLADAEAVLDKLAPLKREVRTEDGRLYMRRLLPYRVQDSHIDGVVITFSDVATEELQAARAYAESIVDTVREALLVLDADLRVVSANRSFYEMFQVSQEETEGRPIYELGNRQWDIPRLRAFLEQTPPEKRQLTNFEVEHNFPSLGPRTMLLNGRLLSPNGGPPGLFLLLAIEDITERKRSRQALEVSEARFRGIVDSAADGIITIDEQGVVLSFNPAAERIFGYAAAEVLGRKINMLMPAPYRDEHDRYLQSYLTTGQARIIGIGREVAGRRKDGSEFPMGLAVSEYHDGTGSRFAGIVKDLSSHKAAEQQLRQREAEVVHAQRLHTVGELAAGLAHDLAQPLAAVANEIGACVRFVQTGRTEPPTLLGALERAGNEAEHAAHVLEHLRQLVEKRPADFRIVDLCGIVDGSVELIRHEIERRQIRLRVDMKQRPLRVKADRVQIEQVIVNLLQNAIDAVVAADAERREIDVQCRQSAPGTAEVAVHDSGPGIGEANFAKLFAPFFTTKPQGLGMGLAISRTIVEAHAGRIWAERTPAEGGTAVRFTLPLLSRRAPSKRSAK
jgi:two-component system, chemotaxis family, CheB/CheR fusion protein